MKNNQKDYGWALVLFIILVAVLTSSCSSLENQNIVKTPPEKKSTNRVRRSLDNKLQSNQSQFAIINNQIIMFENNN
jgi:hypothetical protein